MFTNAKVLVLTVVLIHFISFTLVGMILMLGGRGDAVDVGYFLSETSPHFFMLLGVGMCISLSITGSATGIFTVGSTILGMGVKRPHVKAKNLISIIFCEAEAIYGLIISIVMIGHIQPPESRGEQKEISRLVSSYFLFGAGLTVGLVNMCSSTATGVIGSGTCLADGANPNTFVKNLLLEIFAGAIGLFGLVIGVYICSRTAQ